MNVNRTSTWVPLLAALLAALAGALVALPADAAAPSGSAPVYVGVPAGTLASALAGDGDSAPMPVAAFGMRSTPVTRAEFERFVEANPAWRRDRAPGVLAAAGYLRDWRSPALVPEGSARAPVVNVSWFAAQAFCKAEGGRLPTWTEWEYAAAADATRRDARDDPAWLARILGWYSRPSNAPLPDVGGEPSLDGVRDLHGLVWEWVDEVGSLIVDGDSRAGDDPDRLKFCGAGAINLQDRRNYAVLMRIALLSSLRAADSTGALGLVRAARDRFTSGAAMNDAIEAPPRAGRTRLRASARRDWLRRAASAMLLLSGAVRAAADEAATAALPKDSVYQLPVDVVDQDGRSVPWAAHRGRPVVVAMFYTSCQAVCPMIVEAMRANHARLSAAARERVDLLLVSFDPVHDTPAVLKRTAVQRELDARWTLATGTPAVVRQLAAVLGVQYKARPDGEFNHSSVLFLLDGEGRVAARTTRLGGADPAFAARMQQLAG